MGCIHVYLMHNEILMTGSGHDRTFPDCMMTFVFGWGKTDIQQDFRKMEISCLNNHQLESMSEDIEQVISDYQVTSAERFKHINNEMFVLGPCDSDSHTPLMVYVRSRAANRERNLQRTREFLQNKKKETKKENKNETAWKPWDQSYNQGWKQYGYGTWKDYSGDYRSQSDSSHHWYKQK